MDSKHFILCKFLIFLTLMQTVYASFKDVTSDVNLGGTVDGVIAAFGDFNADKKADIFMISNHENKGKVEIYFWDASDEEFRKRSGTTINQSHILNVIPGDFNSDGHLDILVAYQESNSKPNQTLVKLFIGSKSEFKDNVKLLDALKDQPAIVDFDGDLQPDLIGEKISDGKRYWWKYNGEHRKFTSMEVKSYSSLAKPHSIGFLDINNDYTADIFIPTSKEKSGKIRFEIWINKEGRFENVTYSYPSENSADKNVIVGQSTFADLDSDGIADHLLPVCIGDCMKSEVRVYSSDKRMWTSVLISENHEDFRWKFIKEAAKKQIPLMTLRIGDYNLDGYPDAVVVVDIAMGKEQYTRKVVLLKNVECEGSGGCYRGRKFRIVMNNALSSIANPLIVGFFDLYENGILDLIVSSYNDTSETYRLHAIKNNVYSDTCFLKVIVLGGSCFSSCSSGVTPYGVNQAGPYVKYVTTGPNGDTKRASATQLSQSAYFALQPPYTVFGLGRTPNFVEKLVIGLPGSKQSPVRKRTWTSIIPNSQVIVIPYPPDEPDEWKSKLLVTPSRLLLLTGSALLATCVFLGAVIALLHWKEKREDLKEKQEAAHKFHFDAM